jgi:hypothetical protein
VKAYAFAGWSDGSTENPRAIDLLTDSALEALYKELGTVVFEGDVLNARTGEPYPNEGVIITVTRPDSSTNTLTVMTDGNGHFSAEYGDYPGNYSAVVSVPETDKHLAGSAGPVSFAIGKDPVQISLSVRPVQ